MDPSPSASRWQEEETYGSCSGNDLQEKDIYGSGYGRKLQVEESYRSGFESRYGSKQQVEEQTYGIGVWFWVWKEATGGGELRIWVR
jgi:hypothetical protein